MYSYIIYRNKGIYYATLATDPWDAAERLCSFRDENEWKEIITNIKQFTIKQLNGETHPLSAFVKGVQKEVTHVQQRELANT